MEEVPHREGRVIVGAAAQWGCSCRLRRKHGPNSAEVTGDFGKSHFFGVAGTKADYREFW